MIEIVIKQFLDEHLNVSSFLEVKTKMPEKYVLFERTGGKKKNHINKATFAFQSYANSMFEAAQLNEELKEVMESIVMLDEVSSIKLNSDYNFTDTTTKKHRYQAVFDIVY